MRRLVGRYQGKRFPVQFARLARTRIAHERAVSLCRMFVLGKATGQWADCPYGHLSDAQVIETILLILEDEWQTPRTLSGASSSMIPRVAHMRSHPGN